MIPVLETERLRLRGPKAEDEEGYIAFFTSDRSRHLGRSASRHEAWLDFALEIGHWALRGFGMWAVTLRPSDRCLGFVGLWYPLGWPEREIGWFLWPEAEGRSIAREAALAARRHAYHVLGWETAVSYIHADNDRSIRLAERLGARPDPVAARPEPDDLVYRHPAPGGAA